MRKIISLLAVISFIGLNVYASGAETVKVEEVKKDIKVVADANATDAKEKAKEAVAPAEKK